MQITSNLISQISEKDQIPTISFMISCFLDLGSSSLGFGSWILDSSNKDIESLFDEHRIPIAVVSIFLSDRFPVGLHHEVRTREGADQHEQGRSGQMEVGDERIHKLELISRRDEKVGTSRYPQLALFKV